MRQFRGVAHVHSTFSFDGQLPLDRLAAFFRDRGIQFVLVSEHVETLTSPLIDQLVRECREHSTDSMLLVPGIEIDALNALFYGIKPVEAWTGNEDLAHQLATGGALVVVSHPVKVRGDLPPLTASLVEAVEVWNTRHDGKLALDLSVVAFWNSLQRRLRRRILPLCGIDFHGPSDFVPVVLQVDCDSLDQVTLVNAIRRGSYTLARGGKPLPFDAQRGTLPLRYSLYSRVYRAAFDFAHILNRVAWRLGIRLPKGVKARARRVF